MVPGFSCVYIMGAQLNTSYLSVSLRVGIVLKLYIHLTALCMAAEGAEPAHSEPTPDGQHVSPPAELVTGHALGSSFWTSCPCESLSHVEHPSVRSGLGDSGSAGAGGDVPP